MQVGEFTEPQLLQNTCKTSQHRLMLMVQKVKEETEVTQKELQDKLIAAGYKENKRMNCKVIVSIPKPQAD